jgi:hypothetical protein
MGDLDKHKRIFSFLLTILLTVFFLSAPDSCAQTSPQNYSCADDWVATDALGRTLADYSQAGDRKPGKYVGLFCSLWHGSLRNTDTTDFDITKALEKNPSRTTWRNEDYYWSEPDYGYYRTLDPWVMKRHLMLFAVMGIDFLFLDQTNSSLNEPEYKHLLDMCKQLRQQGVNVPRIVSLLNYKFDEKLPVLYQNYYKPGLYDSVWFMYEGKPLIMSPKPDPNTSAIKDTVLRKAILNYFTWRPTWAAWSAAEDSAHKGVWRFFCGYPQKPAYRLDNGMLEQVVVSKGTGAPLRNAYLYGGNSSTTTFAPTYDRYWVCSKTGTGKFFDEQWKQAFAVNAPILLITGWNEFKAGAWNCTPSLYNSGFMFQGRRLDTGEQYFVDEFNREFNRDLEPIKGYYGDNYFYQTVTYLRKYKGMQKPRAAVGPVTIAIDSVFADWDNVSCSYKDFTGEVMQRNYKGAMPNLNYVNTTARNDIDRTKVSFDKDYLYFYVKTVAALSPCTDKNWMLLFLDTDRSKATGWEGYDYAVNLTVNSCTQTTLQQWRDGAWRFAANCSLTVKGNQMALSIPRSALAMTSASPAFYFHWADNVQTLDDSNEF